MILDLFAGSGGLDLAATQLGHPVTGIEQWDAACETRAAAGLATVHADVRTLGPADFPTARHLMGGPPCQTFSVAGEGAGRRALDTVEMAAWMLHARTPILSTIAGLDDERTGLILEPLRWALEAVDARTPFETVVLEQVPTVLPVWEIFGHILRAEGYGVETGVLKAEQFGVPQTRRRAFLVARFGRDAYLPAPRHSLYRPGTPQAEVSWQGYKPWISMGDALDRPGPFAVVSNYGTGGDPKNRGRRDWTEPAATVTGKISRFRVVGPEGEELPRFTAAEAGVLQTFPADFPWSGRDIPQQIGNACPPLLAKHVLAKAGITAHQQQAA